MLQPATLGQVMDLAQKLEERNWTLTSHGKPKPGQGLNQRYGGFTRMMVASQTKPRFTAGNATARTKLTGKV